MKISKFLYHTKAVIAVMLFLSVSAFAAADKANGKKKIEFTTDSKEAKEAVAQIVYRIETFQFGPDVAALAKKAVKPTRISHSAITWSPQPPIHPPKPSPA